MHTFLYYLWNLFLLIFYIIYIPIRNGVKRLFAQPTKLHGKVCLVTGSGRGLGKRLCIALAQEGAIVACTGISEDKNKATAELLLQKFGTKAKAYKMNVANKEEVASVCRQVEGELGPIYLLVNNAAIVIPDWEAGEQYVRAVFNVNTLGAIWTTEAVLPKMKERNEGHIVYINSVVALQGLPILSVYAASKAALLNYSQAVRMELKLRMNNRIHVTTIFPPGCNEYNGFSFDRLQLFQRKLLLSTYEEVAWSTLHAIRYRKEEVSPKPWLYHCTTLIKYVPVEVLSIIFDLMVEDKINIREVFSEVLNFIPNDNIIKYGNTIQD